MSGSRNSSNKSIRRVGPMNLSNKSIRWISRGIYRRNPLDEWAEEFIEINKFLVCKIRKLLKKSELKNPARIPHLCFSIYMFFNKIPNLCFLTKFPTFHIYVSVYMFVTKIPYLCFSIYMCCDIEYIKIVKIEINDV